MRFAYEQPAMERELAAATTPEAMEAAFLKLAKSAPGLRDPDVYGRRLFASGLDALVPRLAHRLGLKDVPRGAKSNDNVCILASRIYDGGGHSRVAQDLIERLQPAGAVVLMTATYGGAKYRQMMGPGSTTQTFLNERAFLLLASERLTERVLEAYMILQAMRPSRIILMNHPMDIVAVLAAWPFRDVVEFVHHGDHIPALGATLPFSAHVDLTYTCHLACREGGFDPIYAGMAARRPDPSASTAPRPAAGGVRIATCGGLHKYRDAGSHGWTDYAVAALREPGAELVHIGATDEAFQNKVCAALAKAAIPADRYVFAGFQQSLPAELVKRGVDVYLSSYPETGGKANLEAMATGVPAIVPVGPDRPPLVQYRVPLPRWLPIATPEELPAAMIEARALRMTMDSPEQAAALARELGRFDDYAAGRRPPAAPADDRLP